jgi:hypothetical protein
VTREGRTYVEVENFGGDHHGKKLLWRGWKSIADGLTDIHGDLGYPVKLLRRLLPDLVSTGGRHGIE